MELQNQPEFTTEEKLSFDTFRKEVLRDYRIACESREASLLGRREVLTGKAKFGIFGGGKEVAQIAMAKFFRNGDFRAGYYRDQTFMFATGLSTIEQFFSQLYADTDIKNDPFSAGRQMNSHYATPNVDAAGNFLPLADLKNISSDISPTAAQMPRGLGLAFASKVFRKVPELRKYTDLSNNGNEICFCTIGDASTSEGHFWETVNAAGVLQVPLAIFVWDDGYGISVPTELQTVKGSISAALSGMQQKGNSNGLDIYRLKGWDYAGMCEVMEAGIQKIRETHIPAIFHIQEMTQPQGHSTSGSHERYKDSERLAWEKEWDCIKQMGNWMMENALAEEEELDEIKSKAVAFVKDCRQRAWQLYLAPIQQAVQEVTTALTPAAEKFRHIKDKLGELAASKDPMRRDILNTLHQSLLFMPGEAQERELVAKLYHDLKAEWYGIYKTHLYNEGPKSAMKIPVIAPYYKDDAPQANGFEILNSYFEQLFETNDKVVAFGEDVGHIGDVNQGFSGLQEKFGEQRIFDTGIRELTIMGQGIGLALRGLRPIAEIQYLDYLLYGFQPLSDDVATTHYRTAGQQSVPLIVRTRGHRLEGIWHSGSPMGMVINALRGMYVCVPRNMVQAVGMYNTLLQSNDPAIMIECLNGYRLKEKMPSNLLALTIPLGIPEIVKEGDEITLVSYGSTLRIVQEAAEILDELGISCEVVDVQTLLPFDINHSIVESLKKTSRILFVDEDVPGGAAAYMFNKVMEEQNGYRYLDVAPRTLTAAAHRSVYGSDGDYFSKPNVESVITVVQEMMAE